MIVRVRVAGIRGTRAKWAISEAWNDHFQRLFTLPWNIRSLMEFWE